MGHTEYDPVARVRKPWNAGRKIGAKRPKAISCGEMHLRAMTFPLSGVSEACKHIIACKFRIVRNDFVDRHSVSQPSQDILNGDAQATNTRFAGTLSGFDGDDGAEVDHSGLKKAMGLY